MTFHALRLTVVAVHPRRLDQVREKSAGSHNIENTIEVNTITTLSLTEVAENIVLGDSVLMA